MSHSEYVAKLRTIRDQVRSTHRAAVMAFPSKNPKEELPHIISSYETIEALDRIISAEEVYAPDSSGGVEENSAESAAVAANTHTE